MRGLVKADLRVKVEVALKVELLPRREVRAGEGRESYARLGYGGAGTSLEEEPSPESKENLWEDIQP